MRTSTRLLTLAAAGSAVAAGRRTPGIGTTDLTGRAAVVTGGGSGIGRSLVLLLAQRGATVHVVDRHGDAARAVAAEAGSKAHAHEVDVTDVAALEALADEVFAAGELHLLFNNAGIGHGGPVAETTLADWRSLVEVNLMGVVHGVHVFLPRLLAQSSPAHIVNTASMAGLTPSAGLVPYGTTKAAVVGFSESLDAEVRGQGVRVHALCPGIINTAIVRTATMRGAAANRQAQAVRLYAKRGTSPDVVARAALAAVSAGRPIVPTPRYQVVPAWLLKRVSPRAGTAVVSRVTRS